MSSLVCSLFVIYLLLDVGTALPLLRESPPSQQYGDIIADNLQADGLAITQHLHGGVVAVADPLIKFTVDTAPHLVHLYAILNGVDIPAPLAALAKDIYGRLALVGGKGLGKVGVLASQMGKGALDVGASGLEALNKLLETGALVGIRLGAKVADLAADATITGGKVAADGLTAAGNGLMTASTVADVLSRGISDVLEAIGQRLVLGIAYAEIIAAKFLDDSSTVLENGMIKFNNEQQERIYKALQTYLVTLGKIQVYMTNLIETVQGGDSGNPSIVTGDIKGLSKEAKMETSV